MKHRNLLYHAFLPLFLFSLINVYAAEIYPVMLPATVPPQFSMQRHAEEGFVAGTLVRVQNGFKPIETITDQDMIYDQYLQLKHVLKTAKRLVQNYVCLKINNDTIHTGVEQIVRTAYDSVWQQMGDLQKDACLLDVCATTQNIDTFTLISKPTVLYQIEVEDHTFCIGSMSIIVHNADLVTIGTAMLCLEYVAYAHPVLAIVGSTMGLAEVAYRAYKAYRKSAQEKREKDNNDNEAEEDPPAELFLAERYYYEQRKKELTALRDEFVEIYRGITAIKGLFHPLITTFSFQFLPHVLTHHTPSYLLNISIANELKLSDDRKMALRKEREQEFKLLEKEITELHALLVVHFNELVKHLNEAQKVYYETTFAINNAINIWNANLTSITDSIASAAYEQGIIEEYLLDTIKQVAAELKVIATYYQQSKRLACLQQSSNIFEQVDVVYSMIIDKEQWITKESGRAANNLRIYEHYFAQRGIPTTGFKNQIKGTFNKDRNNRATESLKKAQDKLSNLNNNNGPNKPNKPRNDDDFPNMYEVFKKAAIGKILKDAVEGTRFAYKGVSKIFRAAKDIVELGIQKGDWLYLDKMHGDHIEVFKKCGKAVRTILNMDGTINTTKLAAAAGRRIIEWIN